MIHFYQLTDTQLKNNHFEILAHYTRSDKILECHRRRRLLFWMVLFALVCILEQFYSVGWALFHHFSRLLDGRFHSTTLMDLSKVSTSLIKIQTIGAQPILISCEIWQYS